MYSSSLLQLSSVVNATGLAAQFKSIVPSDLFLALGLGFVIGLIIAIVYRKTYRGVLYSPSFALTLVMLTLITTPVVMCIKSDIALSMGMVGALSIVRFRTAVKDPLDTAYMFWALTMGILLGGPVPDRHDRGAVHFRADDRTFLRQAFLHQRLSAGGSL